MNVSTKGPEDTTVQETLILNFAESNDVEEERLDVIRNISPELSCEIDGTLNRSCTSFLNLTTTHSQQTSLGNAWNVQQNEVRK